MKLTTTETKTTTTKTGTITVADLRAKFRIPADATVRLLAPTGLPVVDDEVIIEVTHVVEAAK